jgi:hypothetical protein
MQAGQFNKPLKKIIVLRGYVGTDIKVYSLNFCLL